MINELLNIYLFSLLTNTSTVTTLLVAVHAHLSTSHDFLYISYGVSLQTIYDTCKTVKKNTKYVGLSNNLDYQILLYMSTLRMVFFFFLFDLTWFLT